MIDSYFYVELSTDDSIWAEFGPYTSFKNAVEILVDHCELLRTVYQKQPINRYDASVVEYIIHDGKKERLIVKTTEERRIGEMGNGTST